MPVPGRQLAIASVAWTLVGIVWYVVVRVLFPEHPMPGTAIAVLTWFSAVASAVDQKWLLRQRGFRGGAIFYALALSCIIVVAAILALSIICLFYLAFFHEWATWPAIRYNFVLDVAWVGVHVIAAAFVTSFVRRAQIRSRPQKSIAAVELGSTQCAVEHNHTLDPNVGPISSGQSSPPAQ
jgi:ABC-type spermidine/putrescine transport system permease subunit II